jgi:hypothetical protein
MSHIVFEREPGARADAPSFTIPKPIGRMMVALAILTIVVAGTSRMLGLHAVDSLAPTVAERALAIRDRPDGGVTVLDRRTGQMLAVIATEDSARFLRTLVRGLGVHTDARDATLDVPFTLAMLQDGQLIVTREGSPRVNSVNGFGLTQVATLQRILVAR